MATKIVTFRIAEEDLTAFDGRAEDAGARRSDLIRVLMALPVEFDVSAIARVSTADGDANEPIGDDLALDAGDPPFEVIAITDKALAGIRSECRAIGVNYNQSVRALNAFLRKYGSHRYLTEAERQEITDMYKLIAKQNNVIYKRIKGIETTLDEIEQSSSVNLTARAATVEPPHFNNGDDADRSTPTVSTDATAPQRRPGIQPADSGGTDREDRSRPRHRGRGKRRHGNIERESVTAPEIAAPDDRPDVRERPLSVPSALERPLSELTGADASLGSDDVSPHGGDEAAQVPPAIVEDPERAVGVDPDAAGVDREESIDEIAFAKVDEAEIQDDD